MKDNEKMTVKNGLEKEYEKYVSINQDGYGNCAVVAGASLGKALDDGLTPEEAEQSLYGHDLTGFLAGCAVQAVYYFHPRGEEFGKWWNRHYNAPEDAKGVVNPAILTINVKE